METAKKLLGKVGALIALYSTGLLGLIRDNPKTVAGIGFGFCLGIVAAGVIDGLLIGGGVAFAVIVGRWLLSEHSTSADS